MNGHFQQDTLYPLSTEPAEGYGADPLTRTGEAIIVHAAARKFVSIIPGGLQLVSDRKDATRFKDYSAASIKAGKLKEAARA